MTQVSPVLLSSGSGKSGVILRPIITAAETSLRRIIQLSTPHGGKTLLAEAANLHVNQVSKQLSGDDCLSFRLIRAWHDCGLCTDSDRGAGVTILFGGEPTYQVETARIYRLGPQRYLPGMSE